jgi:hypothetical protein
MLLSSTNKKITIKKALKWIFSEFSISFVAILFFMTVHDTMTGQSLILPSIVQNMDF